MQVVICSPPLASEMKSQGHVRSLDIYIVFFYGTTISSGRNTQNPPPANFANLCLLKEGLIEAGSGRL